MESEINLVCGWPGVFHALNHRHRNHRSRENINSIFYNNKPIETTNRNDNGMSHYSLQGAILYNEVISSNLKNVNKFDISE